MSESTDAGIAVAINFGCFFFLYLIFHFLEKPKRLCFKKSAVRAEDLEKTVGHTKRYTKQQKKKEAKKAKLAEKEKLLAEHNEGTAGVRARLEKKTTEEEKNDNDAVVEDVTDTPVVVAGTAVSAA
jgi:hypothetical protein